MPIRRERRVAWGSFVWQSEDWGKLIGDVPSATAILDRFLHHAEVLNFSGKSYRLRDQAATGSDSAKPANAPISGLGSGADESVSPRRSRRNNPPVPSEAACET